MTRMPVRLVGRDVELERLMARVDEATSGRPSFVLLVGEAGIGKSVLLATVAAKATDRGVRVLAGSAVETGASMPYLPLVGPLATAVPDGMDDLASTIVRRVVRGSPDDGDGSVDANAATADAVGAARFIEAVFDVLVRRPTLLIVDDVQWADRSTLTVLDYLARRATDVPLAVFAAARDDETTAIARMPIADGRRFEQVALHRLDRAQVADQVSNLLGRQAQPALVDRLFERSAGNPMFVEELVSVGADDAAGSEASATSSAALRALVIGRVERMGEAARSVVEALAVIGRPADEQLIDAVADLPEDAVGSGLDEAARGGVTTTSGQTHDVRHPIVGEVVAAAIAPAAKRRLHRRAAEGLESLTDAGAAGERARHWRLSGDDRRAWAASLEAADEADRAFAFAEAYGALDQALELWPADEPGLAAAGLRAANRAWMSGDAVRALELTRQVESTANADAEGLAMELAMALGRYTWDAGERALSGPAFARAFELVTDATPPEMRSWAYWGAGRGLVSEARYADAHERAVESARAAVEAGDATREGEAWLLAGMSRAFANEDGIDEVRRGLELALDAGDPGGTGHGLAFLVDLLQLAGRRDEALEWAMRGVEACDRLGTASTHGSDIRSEGALLLIDDGRWAEADELLSPADPRAKPSFARALLAMRRGDLAAAEAALAATAVGAAIGGPGMRGGRLELARAELAWLSGDLPGARRAVETVVLSYGVWEVDGAAWRAFWEARLGMPAAIDPRPGHSDLALDKALAAEITARRDGVEAVEAWTRAADAWRSAGRPYEEAWARLRLAEAGFASGDREAPRAALHEATRIADELGATPLRHRAEDLARRARVAARPAPPRRPAPDELSPRERDVLGLIAEGRTNRQIADALFLSPKTVGIHVSRILDKLDATTRGEAVANARRRGRLVTD